MTGNEVNNAWENNEISQERAEEVTNAVSVELTQNLDEDSKLQLIGKIYTALGAEFKQPYTINKELEGKNNKYTKVSVVNPDVPQRSEPEISITIKPNGNIILRINPYDNYENLYFISKEITPDELVGEFRKIKDILTTWKVGNSVLEKRSLDPSNY